MERQTARRGRLLARHGALPVEIAFDNAMQTQSFDAEAALAQFEAIVAVFGGENDGAVSELVGLARKQVEVLRPAVERMIVQQRAALEKELGRADRMAETDLAGARQVWKGIETLYGGKAWAKEFVEKAEMHLKREDAVVEAR
jgi:hypothetical protein